MSTSETSKGARWPLFGWIGLLLIAVFWPINWLMDGLRTHWAFFPLWLGYILSVEAIVLYRRGFSLLSQNYRAYVPLFLFSAPSWWLFELFNRRLGYWTYQPVDSFSGFEYGFYCTISFSVVLPAVFSTTELFSTFGWVQNLGKGPRIGRYKLTRLGFFLLGCLLLFVALRWPAYGVALIWMSLYFILDPVNYRLGQPSLLASTARGDWRLVIALWLGCLTCGFFWEMWNYYAKPKWFYNIPYVDFWYIFEMPLPGYLGYLPFALEVYALYMLIAYWLPDKWTLSPGKEL